MNNAVFGLVVLCNFLESPQFTNYFTTLLCCSIKEASGGRFFYTLQINSSTIKFYGFLLFYTIQIIERLKLKQKSRNFLSKGCILTEFYSSHKTIKFILESGTRLSFY